MTNAEKYLKDGTDIKQLATEMVDYFNFPPYEGIGESSIEEFFAKATKPTLTEDERVILRNMKNVSTIKRDKEGDLVVYKISTGVYYIVEFNHLFQFIKERRRILY